MVEESLGSGHSAVPSVKWNTPCVSVFIVQGMLPMFVKAAFIAGDAVHSAFINVCLPGLSCLVKAHQPAQPDLLPSFSATCAAREKVSMCQTEGKCRQQTGRHGASLARTASRATAALRSELLLFPDLFEWHCKWCPVQSTCPQGEHQNSFLSCAHAHPNLGCNTLPSSPRVSRPFPDTLHMLHSIRITFHCQSSALSPASDLSLELLTCIQLLTLLSQTGHNHGSTGSGQMCTTYPEKKLILRRQD